MKYKLSIIIPHYNSIQLLKKLLLSIPDNDNIQVIIVDDYSPVDVKKEYYKLKEEFDQGRYNFVENLSGVHNAGAARNIGLKYVEGEWLLFADADDYFLEDFYDIVSDYFDKDYDLVFFKTTSIYLDSRELASRHVTMNNRIDEYLANPNRKNEIRLRTRWDVPFAKLIRTQTIIENKIIFDEVKVANDKFFSTQIGFYAKKIAASNKTIYCITRNRGSLTTKLDLDSFDMRVNSEIKKDNFLRRNLSKKDYAYVGEFYAYEDLFLILERKYGREIFLKYFKIFAHNHMFSFSIRSFRAGMLTSFLRTRNDQKRIKESYQKKDKSEI